MATNELKIGVFIPCSIDQFSVKTGQKMVNLLEAMGVSCYYPKEITCCGKTLFNNGDIAGAQELGLRLMQAYASCSYVVTCGSGCAAYIKRYFPTLFANSSQFRLCSSFVDRVYNFSDFIVKVLQQVPADMQFPYKVAFLDHSRSLRDMGLKESPRKLLSMIEGLELIQLGEFDVDTFFSNDYAAISAEMVDRIVKLAVDKGADFIVVTEPSLLLHIRARISKTQQKIKCRHIVDLIAATLGF